MAKKSEQPWHENFIEYMDFIVHDPNYDGLTYTINAEGRPSWFSTKKTKRGQQHIQWCLQKADELHLEYSPTDTSGLYARVMRYIHPTKNKVCQICGETMCVEYRYPTKNTLKALSKAFKIDFTQTDHIDEIWDTLISNGHSQEELILFFLKRSKALKEYIGKITTKEDLVNLLASQSMSKTSQVLSPGAMSDFPDRYDGFHTYNLCCRAYFDKGRFKENMRSYIQDRRAYEYWSDGNIHAANRFMGSQFFSGTTADHVGPISLGFVHDPRYLQPMEGGDNSSKRNHLRLEDIESIITIYEKTGVYPMSWFSALIWEHIKENYIEHQELIDTTYRNALLENMVCFMYVLNYVMTHCAENGKTILSKCFLEKHFEEFSYDYYFKSDGTILETIPRHLTERAAKELARYKEIAFDAVRDFNDKDNRRISSTYPSEIQSELENLTAKINTGNSSMADIKQSIENIIIQVENKIIEKIKEDY